MDILFVWCLFGIAVQIVGLFCFFAFLRNRPRLLKFADPPGVTIIKPCRGAMDNEAENFKPFFEQDYSGALQILFAVSTDNDPIIPIIENYRARYPHVDAEVVVSHRKKAVHPKFDAIYDAQLKAKHPIVIWSDSDAIVEVDYIRQMVSALHEDGVSLVTTPQFDARVDNLATAVKAVGNNADVATLATIYGFFVKEKAGGWGHSLGFRKVDFDRCKVWETLDTFVVDDQAVPYVFSQNGLKTSFKNIYCPVQFSGKTLKEVYQQKKIWAIFQRAAIGNRYLYLIGTLLFPTVPATLLLLADGEWLWLWCVAFLVRIIPAAASEVFYLRSFKMTPKYFWTVFFWDFIQLYFIVSTFFQKKIRIAGKDFYRISERVLSPV